MDERARKILKKWKRWNNPLTEEEVQYGMKQGVLFPVMELSHEEVVAEVKRLSEEIQLEDAVRAFLFSLSTDRNEYRTALASLLYAKAMPEHEALSYGRYETNIRCAYCGVQMPAGKNMVEVNHSEHNAYRYFPDGYQDIMRADYVMFDLQQFAGLPKVDFKEEDIRILNRIFGLVEECSSANRASALQKMITKEKVLPANRNGIYVVLGVLSACGVFDTPEHMGYAGGFVKDSEKGFENECDLFYPLNYWRGKHGVNYSAVKRIFGGVTGELLNEEHTIRGEIKGDHAPEVKKKSKAEQYFKEGEHCIHLTNEQRYYYGLSPIEEHWDKVVKYSVTHNLHKRSETFFEGYTIKKMIFEQKYAGEGDKPNADYYQEFDMEEETENRTLLIPKTSRGRKKPWTPSMLMTPTYMREQLEVIMKKNSDQISSAGSYNSQNDQMLPLPLVRSGENFEEYTRRYIASLPEEYHQVIANFHEKQRVRVKYGPGDIFRVQISPSAYTYGLILGVGRDVLKWDRVPADHPMRPMMAQPILFRQYRIVTENGDMTPEDLADVEMFPMELAQDNEILWETYPIVGHKRLEENDIDLGFACSRKTGEVYWGFSHFTVNPDIYQDVFADRNGEWFTAGFATSLWIPICMVEDVTGKPVEKVMWCQLELRRRILKELGMPADSTLDDIAARFGGPTRKEYIAWVYRGNKK